jgi:hypothetical protein
MVMCLVPESLLTGEPEQKANPASGSALSFLCFFDAEPLLLFCLHWHECVQVDESNPALRRICGKITRKLGSVAGGAATFQVQVSDSNAGGALVTRTAVVVAGSTLFKLNPPPSAASPSTTTTTPAGSATNGGAEGGGGTSRMEELTPNGWVKGKLLAKGAFGKVYIALNSLTGHQMAVKEIPIKKAKPAPLKSNLLKANSNTNNPNNTSTSTTSTATATSTSASASAAAAAAAAAEEEKLSAEVSGEISLMQSLDHRNVVKFYSSQIDKRDSKLYIFMELVAGGSVKGDCMCGFMCMEDGAHALSCCYVLCCPVVLHEI